MTTRDEGEMGDARPTRIGRRALIARAATTGAVAWTAPVIFSASPAAAAGSPPPTSTVPSGAVLELRKRAPRGVYVGATFPFHITARNVGDTTARNVVVDDVLPEQGDFFLDPPGPVNGGVLRVELGDLEPGGEARIEYLWSAPREPAVLTNRATVSADGATGAAQEARVDVSTFTTTFSGAAAVTAGTGLRLQPSGSISVSGIPAGSSVIRAFLVWAVSVFRAGSREDPAPDTIRLDGALVTADFRTGSGILCITGDENEDLTVGYLADVTALVPGNGAYQLTDYPNESFFPWTEGASLIVLHTSAAGDQVLLDTRFEEESGDFSPPVTRSFGDLAGGGAASTLALIGPGGQRVFASETVTVTGSSTLTFENTFDGSAGREWDDDSFAVSPVLPVGQSTLDVEVSSTNDCIALSAAVLSVSAP